MERSGRGNLEAKRAGLNVSESAQAIQRLDSIAVGSRLGGWVMISGEVLAVRCIVRDLHPRQVAGFVREGSRQFRRKANTVWYDGRRNGEM